MTRELEKARSLREKLQEGRVVLGAQIALHDATVVEIFGRAGFDWLVVDTEHSAHSVQTIKTMLQTAVPTNAVLLVRALRLDRTEIQRYLDLGSPGILCPFIEDAEGARQLVAACRYPPDGVRGYGPRRAGGYGFDADSYFRDANQSMLCIPIIESLSGVDNIDDILAVDGIDGVVIGPADLSIDLGVSLQYESDRYLETVDRVRQACLRQGKAMGTGCYSLEHALECKSNGDALLLVAGDDGALRESAAATIAALT